MPQLHVSDQQLELPTKVRIILEVWRYILLYELAKGPASSNSIFVGSHTIYLIGPLAMWM